VVKGRPVTGGRTGAAAVMALACLLVMAVPVLASGQAGAAGSPTTPTGATSSTSATSSTTTTRPTSATSSTTTTRPGSPSQAQIDSTESQVAALVSQISYQQAVLDQADEAYNRSVVRAKATQASLQTTAASIAADRSLLDVERARLRDEAVQAYIGDSSSGAVAALFSSPTSTAQIRNLYSTISAANLAADVARINAGQRALNATQSRLLVEQQSETAQLAHESLARQKAADISAQSVTTLGQVKGILAEEVAQQAANQAMSAVGVAATAKSASVADTAAIQASQDSQVAGAVGNGSPAAASAAAAADQAAGLAATIGGSWAGPVTITGGGLPQPAGTAAVHAAMAYLGVPYVWGGMGPQGVDCSGLTALAWAAAGVPLPHSAADQYAVSHHVSMSELIPGDLLFYDFNGTGIDHVVMYVGPTVGGLPTPYGSDTVIEAAHTGTVVKFAPYWPAGLVGAARP